MHKYRVAKRIPTHLTKPELVSNLAFLAVMVLTDPTARKWEKQNEENNTEADTGDCKMH